jgi:hypothetical protein
MGGVMSLFGLILPRSWYISVLLDHISDRVPVQMQFETSIPVKVSAVESNADSLLYQAVHVLRYVEVLLMSILCHVSILCSGTTNFASCHRHMYLMCSVCLVSMVLNACPMYTVLLLHGTQY